MKKEIILNEKYSYKYDTNEKRMRLCIDGQFAPLFPDKLFKYYSLNVNSLVAFNEGYFWLSNPKEFNDPFDCYINLVGHDLGEQSIHDKPLNGIGNIGICSFAEVINDPLMWGYYTNNYNGFSLEVNTPKMTVKIVDSKKRKFSLN